MAVSYSPNGIDWEKPTPWPKYNPPADSHNLPFWNEKENCYMLLSRIWRDGVRITTISRSDDFLNWSKPQECIRGQGFENQIYAMPAFKWGNCYIGLASMFHEGDRDAENFDTVDLELTYAEDPLKFDFVAVGQHVIDRGNGKYPDGEFMHHRLFFHQTEICGFTIWEEMDNIQISVKVLWEEQNGRKINLLH